jgi:hypothetical protein
MQFLIELIDVCRDIVIAFINKVGLLGLIIILLVLGYLTQEYVLALFNVIVQWNPF